MTGLPTKERLAGQSPVVRDLYGLALTTSTEAALAYCEGVRCLLGIRSGGLSALARSVGLDPTFALGHAALALLGHEYCAPVDLPARMASARRHAARSTPRERSHVHAVLSHIDGDSEPLIAHLREHPRDALLLSVAVPTIAFAGVTSVPQDAWAIVEGCRDAYGDDWFFSGLLAFVRQEQGRFDEAMSLSELSLGAEPVAGHSVHARAHVHYETGEHGPGLVWINDWIGAYGAGADNLAHFSWHAGLHELSELDLGALRQRYDRQLAPPASDGCRALVDAASLLWRWSITPGAVDVPHVSEVLTHVSTCDLETPTTSFVAMHAAVALCAAGDVDRLRCLRRWCLGSDQADLREVAAPLAASLVLLADGHPGACADALGRLGSAIWRCGGSDAQREVIDDTRLCALVRAGRRAEAAVLLDRRLDRRPCRRDAMWRELASDPSGQPSAT
ncbi:MAG: pyridine nucleotide-disulfide oxidoreductase [Nocardioidaceae bacterium]